MIVLSAPGRVGNAPMPMRLLRLFALLGATVVVVLPLYWVLTTSLKPSADIYDFSTLVPHRLTCQHYCYILQERGVARWLGFSAVVAAGSTLLTLLLVCPWAYYAARHASRLSRHLIKAVALLGFLVPSVFLAILIKDVYGGWLDNSYYSLIVLHPILQVPVCLWLLEAAIRRVPREYEEMVYVDGGSAAQALMHGVLPSCVPALAAASAISVWLSWTNYSFPLLLGTPPGEETVTTGLARLHSGDVFEWGPLMAAALLTVVASTPMLAVSCRAVGRAFVE
ncbi:MAG: carbohydrate ABC transporter permease [Acidobacteriota bacterium]